MVGLVWLCPGDRGQVSRENSWGVGMLDGRVVWWGQFSLGVSLRVVVSSLLLPPTSVT